MPEALLVTLVVIGAALVASCIYLYRTKQDTKRQLDEYKDLFDLADVSQKETQARVEKGLTDISRKDVLLGRSGQVIEQYMEQHKDFTEQISGLKSQVSFQEEQYAKLFSQKKSSEVRTGKITEQIAPFLEDYPLNSRTARFIGDPIDFVHFDEDKVTFVEVKSGKSQLSKKQRMIRDLIKEGKVEFIIYRVEGK